LLESLLQLVFAGRGLREKQRANTGGDPYQGQCSNDKTYATIAKWEH
jgi:hypothetical protein